ncbi:hypothetical protein EDD86DRAFT_205869 [Gorgonomyces haynaldii]|nr:hypothetical protein EDD86DRAFT_205869 [Gorgonomyces haynaldii]
MSFVEIDDIAQFSVAGFTLNTEEKAALKNSLVLKKDQEKLSHLSFWGKIQGVQRDYYLAQSWDKSLFERKYYYSVDLINWLQLPELTPQEASQTQLIQTRFSGDPAFETTLAKAGPEDSDVVVKEEKRLAGVISSINYQIEIVPRGAYYRDRNMNILLNPSFKGLDASQISRETHYLHFRPGFDPSVKTLSERENTFDESIDIFGSIESDSPKGVWSIHAEETTALVRNLEWPGYTFIHTTQPLKFGGVYFGTGQRNQNIGFLL